MTLLDRLLRNAVPSAPAKKKVVARVLLDESGRVQDIKLRRSCGDADLDAQALRELGSRSYPAARTGKMAVRRWHEATYTFS